MKKKRVPRRKVAHAKAERAPSGTVTSSAGAELDLTAASSLDPLRGARLIGSFVAPALVELKGVKITVLSPSTPADVPGSPPEPVYSAKDQDDIQGNVIPGFNKDHQRFLFYRIVDVKQTKAFLKWLAPRITSMEEVIAFRRLFRARRLRLGRAGIDLCSTWVNIGFSQRAIARLKSKVDANAFGDKSFRQGLAARSAYLGDPTSRRSPGHSSRWVVGGPKNQAEIVIIVASDSPAMLEAAVTTIAGQAERRYLELIFDQKGETLPGDLRGHEHFGFRDGVSQPGVRGKLSSSPGDYITPRYIDDTDPRRLYFAKPGQLLVWPGQFLLGEERQSTEDRIYSVAGASNFPGWARRGSYLVVRRLAQDVHAFWTFVGTGAARLGIDATQFASMLVGRWPSGAPLMRAPTADNPALGGDEFANNHFLFDDDTRPSNLRPILGYPGDSFPPAMADFLAQVCPHFAHIRKANPRDTATEMGKPEDSIVHMILRRGIPYGPPLLGVKKPKRNLLQAERGLMFLSYGSTIEDQFEFLQRRWSNSRVQPNFGGHDPIIGQNGKQGSRVRVIDFPTGSGPVRLKFKEEWVTPTGGGYFFAPTISAIENVLS